MEIDFKLTEKDLERIAEIAVQKLSDNAFFNKVTETSEKVAEKKYWHVFDKNHSCIEINHLLEKHLSKVVKNVIEEQNLVRTEVNKVLNTDNIKRLGAERLRSIAYQLEKEAEELENK